MQPHEFYERLPDGRFKFRVDHHTINDYNTCDRYFKYRHLPADPSGQVWGTKTLNIKIALGAWWSSTMELYYNEMSPQHGPKSFPAETSVSQFAIDAWKLHDMERYRNDPVAKDVYDKFGGPDGACLMALEYHKAFGKSHYTNWTVLGPELGFGWQDEVLLGEDDRVVVYYGGKPDLTIYDKSQNMVMPLDFKTKDSIPYNAHVMYKPHSQTAGYIFGIGKIKNNIQSYNLGDTLPPTKCIIFVCARFRPTDKPRAGSLIKPRFVPIYPHYTQDEIEEWRLSVIEKCRRLRDSLERDVFPPRESACHLYAGCVFRRVCSAPANIRETLLRADFVKQDPWIPYSIKSED
jgi:hypothetical protein